jgi:hypothetical protein
MPRALPVPLTDALVEFVKAGLGVAIGLALGGSSVGGAGGDPERRRRKG